MFDNESFFQSSQTSQSSNGEKGKGKKKSTGERRTQLKRYDHTAAQVIQPFGASPIEKCSLRNLWTWIRNGGKSAKYFSHLAAEDDATVGTGISCFVEITLLTIERIKSDRMSMFAKESMLTAALAEANELEIHLHTLNGGKKKKQKTFHPHDGRPNVCTN